MKILQLLTFHTKLQRIQNHCIRFDKIDGSIRVPGGELRHLALFDHELFDKIFDKIKYLKSEKKNGITEFIDHNVGEIRIDLYDSLPIEKILTFHNVIILTKSIVNNDKNNYYYSKFLEKGSYKDKFDTRYF